MRTRWLGLLAVVMAAGCGGSSNEPVTQADAEKNALSDVGELYRMYTFEKKKAPTKVADFTPLEAMNPMGWDAIRKGGVIVRFGANLPDTNEGPGTGTSDEVLAYQKQVPVSGGEVLMLNRTIKTMTADEFKSAKLAGTSSSAPDGARPTAKSVGKK